MSEGGSTAKYVVIYAGKCKDVIYQLMINPFNCRERLSHSLLSFHHYKKTSEEAMKAIYVALWLSRDLNSSLLHPIPGPLSLVLSCAEATVRDW